MVCGLCRRTPLHVRMSCDGAPRREGVKRARGRQSARTSASWSAVARSDALDEANLEAQGGLADEAVERARDDLGVRRHGPAAGSISLRGSDSPLLGAANTYPVWLHDP